MRCFEIEIELFLKTELDYKRSLEPLSKMVASSLCEGSFKSFHQKNDFKYYVISNLANISSNGVYLKGLNRFVLRTVDNKIAIELVSKLFNYEDKIFKVKNVSLKGVLQKRIKALISLNPVILTYTPPNSKPRYWTMDSEKGLWYLLENLHKNLVKKYENFFGEKIPDDENFIGTIQIKNKKPLSIYYHKNGVEFRFFGNKFYIVPKEDKLSQNLAFLAFACGIGEKNALGGGFCRGYFI